MPGANAGIGKGFIIVLIVCLVLFAAATAVAAAMGSLFHDPIITTCLGALAALGITYLCYQPRRVCLASAVIGGASSCAATAVSAQFAGAVGVAAGILTAAVMFVVLLFICFLLMPKQQGGAKAWRK